MTTSRPRSSTRRLHRPLAPGKPMFLICSSEAFPVENRTPHSSSLPVSCCRIPLCKSRVTYEISQVDMPLRIQQHIVRLQIPVDDALRMDVPQGTTKLGHPESHRFLRETLPQNMKSKITAIHKIDHDIAKPQSATRTRCERTLQARLTCIQCPGSCTASCTGTGGSSVPAFFFRE